MSESENSPRTPRWLAGGILALLGCQLALIYVQGLQIHRQGADLKGLRQDVQALTEALEGSVEENAEPEGDLLAPARHRRRIQKPRLQKTAWILEEEPEPAARELETARKDAQKAVKEAREVQQKADVQEAYRKGQEQVRQERAQHPVSRYVWAGLGLVGLALVLRVWLRRRG